MGIMMVHGLTGHPIEQRSAGSLHALFAIACHSCLAQGRARLATIALRHLAKGALHPLAQGRIFASCRISLRCFSTIVT